MKGETPRTEIGTGGGFLEGRQEIEKRYLKMDCLRTAAAVCGSGVKTPVDVLDGAKMFYEWAISQDATKAE